MDSSLWLFNLGKGVCSPELMPVNSFGPWPIQICVNGFWVDYKYAIGLREVIEDPSVSFFTVATDLLLSISFISGFVLPRLESFALVSFCIISVDAFNKVLSTCFIVLSISW